MDELSRRGSGGTGYTRRMYYGHILAGGYDGSYCGFRPDAFFFFFFLSFSYFVVIGETSCSRVHFGGVRYTRDDVIIARRLFGFPSYQFSFQIRPERVEAINFSVIEFRVYLSSVCIYWAAF